MTEEEAKALANVTNILMGKMVEELKGANLHGLIVTMTEDGEMLGSHSTDTDPDVVGKIVGCYLLQLIDECASKQFMQEFVEGLFAGMAHYAQRAVPKN